jgi:erythromycin esterase
MTGKQSLRLSCRKEKIGQEPADDNAVSATEGHRLAEGVLERLEQSREDLLQKHSAKDVEWAIQNARVVAQCMEMRAGGAGLVRDRCMAENVAWIQKQNPDAKIVLWAHNYHVAKHEGAMGWHLERKFGDDYVAIGFATARGTYQAIAQGRGLSKHKLAEPPAGSIEHAFQRTGLPRFLLDLRQVRKVAPASRWLMESRLFRGVGALAMDQQFTPQNLTQLFDAVIYIEETSRARPIQR